MYENERILESKKHSIYALGVIERELTNDYPNYPHHETHRLKNIESAPFINVLWWV